MPLFHYRASDQQGNLVQGTLEAREERLVVSHLQQGGLIPIRISLEEQILDWSGRFWAPWRRRISLKDVLLFTREMAALLKAGLPLDRSLQALQQFTSRPGLQRVISQTLRDLQAGKSLAEALRRYPAFPPLYISLVEAGEAGGFLAEALSRLEEYLESLSDFQTYVFTALIYPAVLATMGGLALVLMLVYVVPRFEIFFKEMGHTLFWSTQVLLSLSKALRSYWWLGMLLLAGAVVLLWRLAQSSKGRLTIDRFKLTAPVLGPLHKEVAGAVFAKTLGTLIKSGVPLVTGLKVVHNAITNKYLSQALAGVQQEVEKGQRLSSLLMKVGMLPDILVQMAAVGEETGHLDDMLLSAGDSLEHAARSRVKRFLAWLEPALILSTAMVVAFIIVSLLLPILNLYEINF